MVELLRNLDNPILETLLLLVRTLAGRGRHVESRDFDPKSALSGNHHEVRWVWL
jgi:hypothetical protein